MDDLDSYLGTQLVHQCHGKALYTKLLDRYKQKMKSWKSNFLSFAGRITLAKSDLTSLPMFQMQTSLTPASVTKEMGKQGKNFIWGSKEVQRKAHLVS